MGHVIRDELMARDIDVTEFSISEMRHDDFRNSLERADVLIVGTPTAQRDAPAQVWQALSLLSSVTPQSKLGAVFGSFGWSGEAVPMVSDRLRGLKYKLVGEGLAVRFAPTDENLAQCKQFGQDISAAVLQKFD